ncbi:MAG: sigma-54 dependent transcriptional regulator [Proteobacteria bacterium]|nr:sigma-54 dependent transcriptional regulator [Pseudomonadota bacterium]MBU1611732.1 sigma-54 dependent transcriptional regulator [Pseudomonadota bacterium]
MSTTPDPTPDPPGLKTPPTCRDFWKPQDIDLLRTSNPSMREVFRKIQRVAATRTTVLLSGETGVGKGTMAHLLHRYSNRAEAPFVSIHCGAIPDNLVESELFGHEKGAFTGASKLKTGKFEVANRGTVFLDEIDTLPPASQIKLLDVLQTRTIQRVGGTKEIEVDIRIIAATNDDLESLCHQGLFRKDLFYRLNVFPLSLPPLRERIEDLPLLISTILTRLCPGLGACASSVEPAVVKALMHYSFPGNVRELENLLERALILEGSDQLTQESFPAEVFTENPLVPLLNVDTGQSLAQVRKQAIEEVEFAYLRQLLERNQGRIDNTAKDAGVSTRQLHKLMLRHGLDKKDYK